jgi:Ser/Thr protein kinase RdoA (MazF antagonist)
MTTYFYGIALEDKVAFTARFMPLFLQGYRSKFDYNSNELAEIPYFMRIREIDLFAIIQRDIPNWESLGDAWLIRMMDGQREAILAERPYVDFDFSSLG